MHSRTRFFLVAIGLLTFFLIGVYPPVRAQTIKHATFNPGDVIPVKLDRELSSSHSRAGDRFTASVDSGEKGYGYLSGAKVEGRVTKARRKEGDQPGVLGLTFTRLIARNGKSYDIQGSLFALDSKDIDHRPDGVLVAKQGEQKKYLEYAGIGAGGGALVGLLGNGKLDVGKTLIGGALGAGVAQLTKGKSVEQDVTLKPGTKMGVRLDRRLEYRAS